MRSDKLRSLVLRSWKQATQPSGQTASSFSQSYAVRPYFNRYTEEAVDLLLRGGRRQHVPGPAEIRAIQLPEAVLRLTSERDGLLPL
jgi:hypothetical protein